MNVSLTPELEKIVFERVASGLYASASEVIREALRLLEEPVPLMCPATHHRHRLAPPTD